MTLVAIAAIGLNVRLGIFLNAFLSAGVISPKRVGFARLIGYAG